MIKAIIVAEGDIVDTVSFKTKKELDTFGRGLNWGAELYAGSIGLYTEEDIPNLETSNFPSDKKLAQELKKKFEKPSQIR